MMKNDENLSESHSCTKKYLYQNGFGYIFLSSYLFFMSQGKLIVINVVTEVCNT